ISATFAQFVCELRQAVWGYVKTYLRVFPNTDKPVGSGRCFGDSVRFLDAPRRGGARGRSRTDTLLKAAAFLTTSTFAAPRVLVRHEGSWSGARLHLSL